MASWLALLLCALLHDIKCFCCCCCAQGVVSNGQSSALGYSYAALMFVGLVIGTLCDNQHFQRVMRAGAPNLALVT